VRIEIDFYHASGAKRGRPIIHYSRQTTIFGARRTVKEERECEVFRFAPILNCTGRM